MPPAGGAPARQGATSRPPPYLSPPSTPVQSAVSVHRPGFEAVTCFHFSIECWLRVSLEENVPKHIPDSDFTGGSPGKGRGALAHSLTHVANTS